MMFPPNSVLVLEEDFQQAKQLGEALEREGRTIVGPCDNDVAALEYLRLCRPSCALLTIDLARPGQAFALAHVLTRMEIPFAFVGDLDRGCIPDEFADVPLISKRFEDRDLIRLLRELLSRP